MFCNIKIRCGGPILLGNARAQTFKVSEKSDLRNFICVSFFFIVDDKKFVCKAVPPMLLGSNKR